MKALPILIALFVTFSANAETESPPPLGIIAPLSGALAEYGAAIQNGVQLLQESKDAQPPVVRWEDHHGDTKTAVLAFEKLASVDKVAGVFIWGATPTEGVAPVAETQKVPLVASSISPTVAKNRNYTIRSISPSSALIAPVAEHVKKSGAKKVMLLTTEWTYTEELSKAFKKSMPDTVEVSEITFKREELDFKPALTRLRTNKPDMVGVLLSTGQISLFYRQLAAAGLKIPSFGSDFFSSQKEITDSGAAIEGAVYPHLAVCAAFADKYRERFGNDTHIAYAVNGYDMLQILFDSVARGKTREDLLMELKSDREYQGVCGNIRYRNDPEVGSFFEYPVALYRIEEGKVVYPGPERVDKRIPPEADAGKLK